MDWRRPFRLGSRGHDVARQVRDAGVVVRRRLAKLRSSDPGPSHHRTVLHQRASDYAKAVAAGVGPRAQHALHWSRSRARDLTRHAQISAELALRRWETKPARFRQRVTLGTGLALVVGIAGLTVWLWPRPAPPPEPHYTLVSLQALPGWPSDTVLEARPALDRSCAKLAKLSPDRSMAIQGHAALRAVTGTVANWQAVCARLDQVPADDPQAFRGFLLRAFAVYAVTSSDADAHGLFTGYFEAHIDAARTRGGRYTIPVYGPPKDLVMESGQGQRRVNGVLEPYTDRAAIEDGALEGKAPVLFWAADAVDLHILHIQGSGRVTLPDGRQTRIGYAANNGQPFVGIGRLVRERGLADGASMPAIRTWLRTHPEDGRALMRENPRYIFFREIAGTGPVGAFGVTLTPLRSLAVDPQFLPLGSLVWLDTTGPDGVPIQRLMAAQDVGSAIKGINRGDVFWGGGEAAFDKAGRMASPGQTYLLVPRPERPVDPLMM